MEQPCKSRTTCVNLLSNERNSSFLDLWPLTPVLNLTLTIFALQGAPEPKSLEERLLCVEVSETSVDVIRVVMEAVASIATFVSFLPLANRVQMCSHLHFLHLSFDRTTMSSVKQKFGVLQKKVWPNFWGHTLNPTRSW